MADAGRHQNDVIHIEVEIFAAAAAFLPPVKQDVELIFIFVPVITVVEHIVDKAADGEIFPGPVQLIICNWLNPSLSLPKSKYFPCGKGLDKIFNPKGHFKDNR